MNEVSRISQEHYPEGNLSVFMFHNTLLLKFLYQECLGVNWLLLGSLETLALVASLIPPSILAGCFEKLAKNYRYWSGGQPDLFLWRTAPEEQVKFVEVKGPSDRLSERQHFWICLLMSFGANAAVAKVKPEDVKETLH